MNNTIMITEVDCVIPECCILAMARLSYLDNGLSTLRLCILFTNLAKSCHTHAYDLGDMWF